MKNSSILNIDLNIKDFNGGTAFHLACQKGHSEIADMIMNNSSKLQLDLNIKDSGGRTAFHRACMFNNIKTVDLMIEQSESLDIDLKAKDNNGKTGYQWAKFNHFQFQKNCYGYIHIGSDPSLVVNLIQTKMPNLLLDLE